MSDETPDVSEGEELSAEEVEQIDAEFRLEAQTRLRDRGEGELALSLDGLTMEEISEHPDARVSRVVDDIFDSDIAAALGEDEETDAASDAQYEAQSAAIAKTRHLLRPLYWSVAVLVSALASLFIWLGNDPSDDSVDFDDAAHGATSLENNLALLALVALVASSVVAYWAWRRYESRTARLEAESAAPLPPATPIKAMKLPPSGRLVLEPKLQLRRKSKVNLGAWVSAGLGVAYLVLSVVNGDTTERVATVATLATAALIVAVSLMLRKNGRVELDRNALRYRRNIRNRSVQRDHIAEVVKVPKSLALVSYGIDPNGELLVVERSGRVRLRIAEDQFAPGDIKALLGTLGVPFSSVYLSHAAQHVRYPGSVSLFSRRPYVFSSLLAILILAALVGGIVGYDRWNEYRTDAAFAREDRRAALDTEIVYAGAKYFWSDLPQPLTTLPMAEEEAIQQSIHYLTLNGTSNCTVERFNERPRRMCSLESGTNRFEERMLVIDRSSPRKTALGRSGAKETHVIELEKLTPLDKGYTVSYLVSDDGGRRYSVQLDLVDWSGIPTDDIYLYELDDIRCNNDPDSSVYRIKSFTNCRSL